MRQLTPPAKSPKLANKQKEFPSVDLNSAEQLLKKICKGEGSKKEIRELRKNLLYAVYDQNSLAYYYTAVTYSMHEPRSLAIAKVYWIVLLSQETYQLPHLFSYIDLAKLYELQIPKLNLIFVSFNSSANYIG